MPLPSCPLLGGTEERRPLPVVGRGGTAEMLSRSSSRRIGSPRSIGSVKRSSVAVLAYDVVYSNWKDTDLFPHVGSKPFINVGYVDGHVSPVSAQAYLTASPRPPPAEGTNQFLKEGWD